jgi:hypothetical protein
MLATARELVQSTVDLSSDRAIVLGRSEWHAGVIGICCREDRGGVFAADAAHLAREGAGPGLG